MSSKLILPPEVILGQQIDAQLQRNAELRSRHGHLRYIESELKRLDPRLSLVKASEHPTQSALVPGAWHIRRENEQTMPTYLAIVDDDGRPREPSLAEVYRLQKGDMQRPGWFEDLRREQDRREAVKESERVARSEQHREQIKDLLNVYERPSVGYSGEKWTNSTKGKRGR